VPEFLPGTRITQPSNLDPPSAANSSKVVSREPNHDRRVLPETVENHLVVPETVRSLIGSRLELSDTQTGSTPSFYSASA